MASAHTILLLITPYYFNMEGSHRERGLEDLINHKDHMTPGVKGLLLGSGQRDEDSNEVPWDTASWVGLSAQDEVGRQTHPFRQQP